MNVKYLILIILMGGNIHIWGQEDMAKSHFSVAFYNVENLFDTEDHPDKKDEAFTAEGSKKWTKERYDIKLGKLAQVVGALGKPAIVGVCEVENKAVLKDLAQTAELADAHYEVAHFESPDVRGIDVGLLYDVDLFTLEASTFIRIEFPLWLEPDGYTSRDILQASLKNKKGEIFHVFVNHWPSRRGGEALSEKRRLWVASHLRRAVNNVLAESSNAKIIIMGDFNDEASNRSISNVLGTIPLTDSIAQLPGVLYNPFLQLEKSGLGSYNYRGDWNMLDQIIIAGFDETSDWKINDFGIFKEDWLLYKGQSPSKTYGGPNYYGGYSDHLPVFMSFSRPALD